MKIINREYKKPVKILIIVIAIMSAVLISYLAILNYQNQGCSSQLSNLRTVWQQKYNQFLTSIVVNMPALMSAASSTKLSTSGFSITMNSNETKEAMYQIAQIQTTQINDIKGTELALVDQQQKCDKQSAGMQTWLYVALFLSALSTIGNQVGHKT